MLQEEEAFGKERGHDLFEGKMTLPLIHTYAQASADERSEIARIVSDTELSAQDLDYICRLIDKRGGIEYTRNKAAERIATAKQLLAIFPDCAARQALFDLADYVVSRNK